MASFPISEERTRFPGKTDEQIASLLAQEFGYIVVVKYKNSPLSDFENFGCCKEDYEVKGYLNSSFCHGTEIIYDARPNPISLIIKMRLKDTLEKIELSEDELNRIYLQANHKDFIFRLEAILRLSKIATEKAYYELTQTAALDFRGELRIAAILSLVSIRNNAFIEKFLKEWIGKFDGADAKTSLLLALSILNEYNVEKALNFSFIGKDKIIQDIEKSNYKRSNIGTDRIAFFLTYFFGLDGSGENEDLIRTIVEYFPDYKELLNAVHKWMRMSL
jgi:hypothetical protein